MIFKKIPELVREMEQADRVNKVTSSKYVTTSMREDINRTEAYINSKHISGDKDSLGRDKPFFNIVTAQRNIWYRATDIQRKNIMLRATKEEDQIEAFLATIKLHEWMKKTGFAKFLDDWGLALATHGSAVTKFVEKGGELVCKVVDWNTLFCDAVDFENNLKVEKFWFTPAQLRKQKTYNQDLVEQLLENQTRRETLDGMPKDGKENYIPIYEVHGELPLSFITEDVDDEDEYVDQIHIITFQAMRNDKGKLAYNDYTLYSGREVRSPYMLTHLIKKDDTTYTGGAVKNLFEAQWMVNHTVKQMKDQLDLASKIIFQTADTGFAGNNVLTGMENGDIMVHAPNMPLERVAGQPDIAAMEAFQASWQKVANEINGISEAMQGAAPKSGTSWRLQQATLNENYSLFELMTKNKGLAIIDMLTDFILPFFKKQLNNSDEINSILEEWQIKKIDSLYIPNEVTRRVNAKKKHTILSGHIYDPGMEAQDTASAQQEIQNNLTGSQRFIRPSDIDKKTWKEIFKDLEWEIDIDVTNESKDIQGMLGTLSTIFQTLVQNPMVLEDPNVKMVFGRILTLSGAMSPLELQSSKPPQPQMSQMNQQAPAPQGAAPNGAVGGAPQFNQPAMAQ